MASGHNVESTKYYGDGVVLINATRHHQTVLSNDGFYLECPILKLI